MMTTSFCWLVSDFGILMEVVVAGGGGVGWCLMVDDDGFWGRWW
ncbi:hypothetical protein HanXRQr2_Chr16g0730751 [Helianthus annuus]|uniref:Uncharacterized protein n=1 Tax=Helianthus annuus TaxID=4232 RepID=A0A9K3DQT6_HELAN|nr:hypothetical protein HanXRQr2_Chr16g0730751 [Helianthus annuus]